MAAVLMPKFGVRGSISGVTFWTESGPELYVHLLLAAVILFLLILDFLERNPTNTVALLDIGGSSLGALALMGIIAWVGYPIDERLPSASNEHVVAPAQHPLAEREESKAFVSFVKECEGIEKLNRAQRNDALQLLAGKRISWIGRVQDVHTMDEPVEHRCVKVIIKPLEQLVTTRGATCTFDYAMKDTLNRLVVDQVVHVTGTLADGDKLRDKVFMKLHRVSACKLARISP